MSKVLGKTVVLMGEGGVAVTLPVGTVATDELLARVTMPVWVESEPVVEPEVADTVAEVVEAEEAEDADAEVEAEVVEDAGGYDVSRYDHLKKAELVEALEERGLDTEGVVAELKQRLAADDAATA